jgi:hypothetical protein
MSIRSLGRQSWKMRACFVGAFAVFATVWAGTAQAQQPPTFRCREIIIPPGPDPDLPKIAPIFRSTTDLRGRIRLPGVAGSHLFHLAGQSRPARRSRSYCKTGRRRTDGVGNLPNRRNGIPAGRHKSRPVERAAIAGDTSRLARATSVERRGSPPYDDVKSFARRARQYSA